MLATHFLRPFFATTSTLLAPLLCGMLILLYVLLYCLHSYQSFLQHISCGHFVLLQHEHHETGYGYLNSVSSVLYYMFCTLLSVFHTHVGHCLSVSFRIELSCRQSGDKEQIEIIYSHVGLENRDQPKSSCARILPRTVFRTDIKILGGVEMLYDRAVYTQACVAPSIWLSEKLPQKEPPSMSEELLTKSTPIR